VEHNFIPVTGGLDRYTPGLGDNSLGPQIRFYPQTTCVPTLAFNYAVKIPAARPEDGLGTGRLDQAFTFLASKDIEHFHVDFKFLIGRPHRSGVDKNQQVNLALSHAIRDGLEVAGEVYGENQLNKTTRGFVSSLRMPTCTVTPRLVTGGGFELGLTSGGPRAFRQGDALGRKSL
jgi:hypothetical protein